MNRVCRIVCGGVGDDRAADGDGAYDLHDVTGTPEEIGRAIADSLRETFMMRGHHTEFPSPGMPLYMTLTICIANSQDDFPGDDA